MMFSPAHRSLRLRSPQQARWLDPARREASKLIALQVSQHLARLRSEIRPDPRRDTALFLDRCLRRLLRQESRCRRVLGELVSVFRKKQAYVDLGFVRIGDFCRERLGISGSEAETAARVAKRLRHFPLLARAFEGGEISWTKARILTAAASEATEERWLEIAKRETVRGLERLMREARKDKEDGAPDRSDVEARQQTPSALPATAQAGASSEIASILEDDGTEVEGEPRVRFRMLCPGWVWLLFRKTMDLARRVAGEELPVWKGVEAMSAEAASAAPRDPYSEGVRLDALPEPGRPWTRRGRMSLAIGPLPDDFAGRESEDHSPYEALDPPPHVAEWLGVPEEDLRDIIPEDARPLAEGIVWEMGLGAARNPLMRLRGDVYFEKNFSTQRDGS